MSVLGDVFGSLQRMTLLQLLFGFLACTGYALAQGSLVGTRVKLWATIVAALCAFGFVLETSQWVYGIMLLAFAVAGLGIFAALAWLLSSLLGLSRDDAPRALDSSLPEPQAVEAPIVSGLALTTPVHAAHSH